MQREHKSTIRDDLVRRVKAEIAAGEYETPQRLEITVNRLTEVLVPDPEPVGAAACAAGGQ